MKKLTVFAGFLILTMAIIFPVQAFTADSLYIAVLPSGDAQIQFNYSLNWVENIAVFIRIADPAKELQRALESNLNRPVTVDRITSNSVSLSVMNFAMKSVDERGTTLTTPPLSFAAADQILKQYWFAPLVNADFSPDKTVISYPDGYKETFSNLDSIPETRHIIPITIGNS